MVPSYLIVTKWSQLVTVFAIHHVQNIGMFNDFNGTHTQTKNLEKNTDFFSNIFVKMGELFVHFDKNILKFSNLSTNTYFSLNFRMIFVSVGNILGF